MQFERFSHLKKHVMCQNVDCYIYYMTLVDEDDNESFISLFSVRDK